MDTVNLDTSTRVEKLKIKCLQDNWHSNFAPSLYLQVDLLSVAVIELSWWRELPTAIWFMDRWLVYEIWREVSTFGYWWKEPEEARERERERELMSCLVNLRSVGVLAIHFSLEVTNDLFCHFFLSRVLFPLTSIHHPLFYEFVWVTNHLSLSLSLM